MTAFCISLHKIQPWGSCRLVAGQCCSWDVLGRVEVTEEPSPLSLVQNVLLHKPEARKGGGPALADLEAWWHH